MKTPMKSRFEVTPAFSYRLFAALCCMSLLIWWEPITATLALALRQDAYSHILLILPISIILVVLEWKRETWQPKPGIRPGSILLVLAILIGVAGLRWGRVEIFTGDVRLSLEMLALLTWWLGSFIVCFGVRIFRTCAFPLLFLLWLVPMPEFVLNRVVDFLQLGTAGLARMLFASVGVPVARDGTALMIPTLTVEVAQECSSIRSSMMLVVSSMVMSYLLLRSFWGRAGVIIAAVPLSIAKNGLRVFTIAMLGAYVDRTFMTGRLHHQGGVLFFAVSLAGMLLLICIFGWAERRSGRPTTGQQVARLSTSGSMN